MGAAGAAAGVLGVAGAAAGALGTAGAEAGGAAPGLLGVAGVAGECWRHSLVFDYTVLFGRTSERTGGRARGRGARRRGGGLRTTAGGTAVGLDALVDSGGDLVDRLLSDALADGGDLGDDSLAETSGGLLLSGELLGNNLGDTELVEGGLLRDQVINGRRGGAGEVGSKLLESQGLLQLQGLGALDVGLSLCQSRLDICGGGLDGSDGAGVVGSLQVARVSLAGQIPRCSSRVRS